MHHRVRPATNFMVPSKSTIEQKSTRSSCSAARSTPARNGVVVYVIIRRTKVDHDIDPEKAIDHVLKYLSPPTGSSTWKPMRNGITTTLYTIRTPINISHACFRLLFGSKSHRFHRSSVDSSVNILWLGSLGSLRRVVWSTTGLAKISSSSSMLMLSCSPTALPSAPSSLFSARIYLHC